MTVHPDAEDGALGAIKRDMEALTAFARQSEFHADLLWNDPLFRTRVAALQAELDALEHMWGRVTQGGGPADGGLAVLARIVGSELRRKVSELIVAALGPFGLVHHDGSAAEAPPSSTEAPGAAPTLAFRRAAAPDDDANAAAREIVADAHPHRFGTKAALGLSDEDAELRGGLDRFTAAEYALPKRAALLAANRDNWDHFAAAGWLGVGIPEAAGGHGGSLARMMLVAERLGAGQAIEPYVGGVVYPSVALQTALDAPAAAKLLAPAVAGRTRLAMACNEAPARGGLRWTRASATPDKGGYGLEGCKVVVAGGGAATHYLVSARTAGEVYDPSGHSLFLVPRDTPGLQVRPWRMIDGADMASVELDGVRVPGDALLGEPGAALVALSAGMDAAIVACAFGVVGAMEAALAATAGRLSQGADMLAELEQARSAAWLGLASLSRPDARRRAYVTSATKAVVVRASNLVCRQAVALRNETGAAKDARLDQFLNVVSATNALRGSLDFHLSRMAMLM